MDSFQIFHEYIKHIKNRNLSYQELLKPNLLSQEFEITNFVIHCKHNTSLIDFYLKKLNESFFEIDPFYKSINSIVCMTLVNYGGNPELLHNITISLYKNTKLSIKYYKLLESGMTHKDIYTYNADYSKAFFSIDQICLASIELYLINKKLSDEARSILDFYNIIPIFHKKKFYYNIYYSIFDNSKIDKYYNITPEKISMLTKTFKKNQNCLMNNQKQHKNNSNIEKTHQNYFLKLLKSIGIIKK